MTIGRFSEPFSLNQTRPQGCRKNLLVKERRRKTLTVANATIPHELESRSDIVHGERIPHPSPVPYDLRTHLAAVECETLRRELLATALEPNTAAGECDVGDTPSTAVPCVHADLRRAGD